MEPRITLTTPSTIFLPSTSPGLSIVKINFVPDTNLTKDGTITKSYKDRCAIISDYVKLASFDDIHLLADITLSANVITWGKHLKLQFEHQIY